MADAAWHAPHVSCYVCKCPAEEANSMADTAYTRLYAVACWGSNTSWSTPVALRSLLNAMMPIEVYHHRAVKFCTEQPRMHSYIHTYNGVNM